jgi:CubicO group peptidase (beta-lactamase class C family)
MTAPEIQGVCDERFLPLKDAFAQNFEDGLELGASVAATWRGKLVVDLLAGWADPAKTRVWESTTVVPVSSTSKIMVTLCLLMLVDRGLIELDAPIARYWLEFGQGGKALVTVRDLFTHQAGVPGFTPPVQASLFLDWDASVARVAAEPHWFEGQRRVVYHAATYGLIAGELIRRVGGRLPWIFFREEVARPADLDFYFGASEVPDADRIASVARSFVPQPPATGLLGRLNESVTWVEGLRPGQLLNISGNGYTNARSIARACAIFAGGGAFEGKRYLSRELVEEARREQVVGECPHLGRTRLGLGFGLIGPGFPYYPSPEGYGWGGFGGSVGWMDTRLNYSLGYAPNNFFGDPDIDARVTCLSKAMRTALAELAP